MNQTPLSVFDPELSAAITAEARRQEEHIELIASENYVSPNVLALQGSVLTNKYAEGYPGKRYYGGCESVDVAEALAIERAKKLFNVDYVNVQPHSGSSANAEVYMALLNPGDTILGMRLMDGGHLTHGSSVNFSGKLYRAEHYGVNPNTGFLDYDELRDCAKKYQPRLIVAGFTAYSRIVDWKAFREIADEVGAYLMTDIAHVAGMIAAGLYPSPVPFADVVTTTTHKTLRGPRGGMIMAKANPDIEKKLQTTVFPGMQGGPLMHVIAAKAAAFLEALQPEFKSYCADILGNAKALAECLQKHEFNIVSGGTDTHLFLLDLRNKQLTGKVADVLLGQCNMTVNKNNIPNDPESPFVTSGVRLGTPAVTTRGFKLLEMQQLANWIADVLHHPHDETVATRVKQEVVELCRKFPVYPNNS